MYFIATRSSDFFDFFSCGGAHWINDRFLMEDWSVIHSPSLYVDLALQGSFDDEWD